MQSINFLDNNFLDNNHVIYFVYFSNFQCFLYVDNEFFDFTTEEHNQPGFMPSLCSIS